MQFKSLTTSYTLADGKLLGSRLLDGKLVSLEVPVPDLDELVKKYGNLDGLSNSEFKLFGRCFQEAKLSAGVVEN